MAFSIDLTGKTALVTGAASGFGAHFARVLAGQGAEVILAGRRVEALSVVAAEIGEAGGRARLVAMDVRDADSVASAFASVGAVDILVNNAGVTATRPLLDQTEADWDAVLDTNLKGVFLVGTAAARAMRAAGRGGAIINIASILGLRQGGAVTPYAVAKAGVVQLTQQMALELARWGIRVNALAPGYFATDLNRAFLASEAGQALINRVPLRRMGALGDLDGPLLLLASDASRFMTGAVLAVDGGHLVSSL